MTKLHDSIRKGLHTRLGINEDKAWSSTDLMMAEVKGKCCTLDRLTQLLKDRLLMGAVRYGDNNYDWPEMHRRLKVKFDAFVKTGNAEMLVDLINYIVIELQTKAHPNHHFEALDDQYH